jgi:hypothetical protein
MQITLLVTLTAMLIAGKTGVASDEHEDIVQLANDVDALENAIALLENDLTTLKTGLGFQDASLEDLARAARDSVQVRKKLGKSVWYRRKDYCGPTTHRSAWIVFFPPTHHRTE